MNDLRIGFIGCGRHAKANIYPSLKLAGVSLVSTCANHIENAQAVAGQYQIPGVYNDYRAMLSKENLDAVFIVLPEQHHAEVVEHCLEAGCHVFVEKPLGLSAEQARHVAEVAQKTGRYVQVGFMKRYAPAYVEMKRFMMSEEFGKVLSITGMFGVRSFGDEEFFLKNAAIHIVDLIRFLFGEVEEVCGYSNSKGEDNDMLFSFMCEGGRIGNMFLAGVPSWARHAEEITITGTQGFVRAEAMRKLTEHSVGTQLKTASPRWQLIDEKDVVLTSIDTSSSGGWKDLYLNGYVGEVQHFVTSISEGRAPEPSAEDNVRTMEFVDLLLSSLRRVG